MLPWKHAHHYFHSGGGCLGVARDLEWWWVSGGGRWPWVVVGGWWWPVTLSGGIHSGHHSYHHFDLLYLPILSTHPLPQTTLPIHTALKNPSSHITASVNPGISTCVDPSVLSSTKVRVSTREVESGWVAQGRLARQSSVWRPGMWVYLYTPLPNALPSWRQTQVTPDPTAAALSWTSCVQITFAGLTVCGGKNVRATGHWDGWGNQPGTRGTHRTLHTARGTHCSYTWRINAIHTAAARDVSVSYKLQLHVTYQCYTDCSYVWRIRVIQTAATPDISVYSYKQCSYMWRIRLINTAATCDISML